MYQFSLSEDLHKQFIGKGKVIFIEMSFDDITKSKTDAIKSKRQDRDDIH